MTFPATDYLLFLLKSRRSRTEADAEAERLKVRSDWAKFWFENVGR